jgi:hypothetical protein
MVAILLNQYISNSYSFLYSTSSNLTFFLLFTFFHLCSTKIKQNATTLHTFNLLIYLFNFSLSFSSINWVTQLAIYSFIPSLFILTRFIFTYFCYFSFLLLLHVLSFFCDKKLLSIQRNIHKTPPNTQKSSLTPSDKFEEMN